MHSHCCLDRSYLLNLNIFTQFSHLSATRTRIISLFLTVLPFFSHVFLFKLYAVKKKILWRHLLICLHFIFIVSNCIVLPGLCISFNSLINSSRIFCFFFIAFFKRSSCNVCYAFPVTVKQGGMSATCQCTTEFSKNANNLTTADSLTFKCSMFGCLTLICITSVSLAGTQVIRL